MLAPGLDIEGGGGEEGIGRDPCYLLAWLMDSEGRCCVEV